MSQKVKLLGQPLRPHLNNIIKKQYNFDLRNYRKNLILKKLVANQYIVLIKQINRTVTQDVTNQRNKEKSEIRQCIFAIAEKCNIKSPLKNYCQCKRNKKPY